MGREGKGGGCFRTLGWKRHGMGSVWPGLPFSCSSWIPGKAPRRIQSIWECDPPSPSPSRSAPHHTHKNEIFLAVLICCLSLQTGLHKKTVFLATGCGGMKLHTNGKAIHPREAASAVWEGRGVGRSQTSRHIKGKPDTHQEGEVTSHRG